MARSFANARYLGATRPLDITAFPFTLSAWYLSTQTASSGMVIALCGSKTTSPYDGYCGIRVAGGGDVKVQIDVGDRSTTLDPSAGAGAIVANRWYRMTAVFVSATDRRLYLNTTKYTGTTSEGFPVGLDGISIGALQYYWGSASPSLYLPTTSYVSDAAVWRTALDDQHQSMLAAGLSADQVDPAGLVYYWPLRGGVNPEPDIVSGYDLAAIATLSNSPPEPDSRDEVIIQHASRSRRNILFLPVSSSFGVTDNASASESSSSSLSSSQLYWDSTGQLVIANSLPPGGSAVPDPSSTDLVNLAPWYRDLDADNITVWHPANYYSGGQEIAETIFGTNLMPNADMSFGVDYWAVYNNAGGGTNYAGPTWDMDSNAPAASHSVGISRTGTTLAASGNFDIIYTRGINVLPSTRYEVSAYLAAINCAASIFINYYKLVGGVETLISSSSAIGAATSDGGDNLNDWPRVGDFITTPSDCQYVKFLIRGGAATASDPKFWGAKLYFGQASDGQTELSPWSVGGNSGVYGELETLTASHEDYVATISVPHNTETIVSTLTFTSIISPARIRKLLVSFVCEVGSVQTRLVRLDYSSGTFTDSKTIYDSTNDMQARFISFSSVLSIPADNDADITLEVAIRHTNGAAMNYEQVTLSAIELPT